MTDQLFMQRALQLAELGKGKVMPNPMVGAVIVHDGQIIGEGFHEKHGEPHAEVNAVRSVTNPELLKESTIYVTLEPCAHYGITPPCAELIVRSQFKRVVIAHLDPHEKVAGKGVRIMEDAGIQVEIGVLEKEARFLNRRFNCYHQNRRPFVLLKWAETLDGVIGRSEQEQHLDSWMTSEASKQLVHEMRANEAAILVGKNTALKDDPSLTVRLVEGDNPLRIVLDRKKELPATLKVFDDSAETLHLVEGENVEEWENLWEELLEELFKKGVQTLIVEGGAKVLEDLIAKDIWDEAYKFVAPRKWEIGVMAPSGIKDWTLINDQLDGDLLYRASKW